MRNGGLYLKRLVKSIQSQTNSHWEAVIVDDGSTDGTDEYLAELISLDPRFIVHSTFGIGRGRALNLAISKCRSDIIVNLDADDLAHPNLVNSVVIGFTKWPEYTVIGGKNLLILDDAAPLWGDLGHGPNAIQDVGNSLAYRNPISHSGVSMRKDHVLEVGGYDYKRLGQYDYDLWTRLIDNGHRIGLSDVCVAAKRSHVSQFFERKNHIKYAWGAANVQWRAIRILDSSRVKGLLNIGLRLCWAVLPNGFRMRTRLMIQWAFRNILNNSF